MAIKNKVALITGSASGMGKQTAMRMAENGAKTGYHVADRIAGEILFDQVSDHIFDVFLCDPDR